MILKERDIENLLEQQLVQQGWVVKANDPARNKSL